MDPHPASDAAVRADLHRLADVLPESPRAPGGPAGDVPAGAGAAPPARALDRVQSLPLA